MAYTRKKTTKKYIPKKKYAKKAFANSLSNVPKNLVDLGVGFPKKMMVKHKYVENVILTSTLGVLDHKTFRLNSLYDPYLSGTGHSPLNFSTMMNIYNHYHVIGAKARVRFISSEANTVPMDVALIQNDDNVFTHTTLDSVGEQGKSNIGVLGSTGALPRTLNFNWSAKKTFGGSVLSNNGLEGRNSASYPTEVSMLEVIAQTSDRTTTCVCYAQVYIEFIAIYTELKDVTT